MPFVVITDDLIVRGKSYRGGWSRKQIELLGGRWPLTHGWKLQLIGSSISEEAAEMFVAIRKSDPNLLPKILPLSLCWAGWLPRAPEEWIVCEKCQGRTQFWCEVQSDDCLVVICPACAGW